MSDRHKFYAAINKFDFLAPLWDQTKHEIRLDDFENRLGTMSSGECHLAKFMAAIWFHDNRYGFDIFQAMTLSDHFRNIIIDWVAEPYWP